MLVTGPASTTRVLFNQQEGKVDHDNGVDEEYWDWADNAEGGLEYLLSPEVIALNPLSA